MVSVWGMRVRRPPGLGPLAVALSVWGRTGTRSIWEWEFCPGLAGLH